MRALLLGGALIALAWPALAHMHDHADLDSWFQGLASHGGAPCCDNSEAKMLQAADWMTSDQAQGRFKCEITQTGQDNEKGHYCVKIDKTWWLVPDRALIDGPNLAGNAMEWHVEYGQSDGSDKPNIFIRCFMPGAET